MWIMYINLSDLISRGMVGRIDPSWQKISHTVFFLVHSLRKNWKKVAISSIVFLFLQNRRLRPASPNVLGGNLPSFIRFYSSRKELSKRDQMWLPQVVRLSSGNRPWPSHLSSLSSLWTSQIWETGIDEGSKSQRRCRGRDQLQHQQMLQSIDRYSSWLSEKRGWRCQRFQASRM